MNDITPKEYKEMCDLYFAWQKARKDKDYDLADKLRDEYKEWDSGLGYPWSWVPVFESTSHRQERLRKRDLHNR